MPEHDSPTNGGRPAPIRELEREDRRREALAHELCTAVLEQLAARRAINDGQTDVESLQGALDHAKADERIHNAAGRLCLLVGGKPGKLVERARDQIEGVTLSLLAGYPPWLATAPIQPAPAERRAS